ncbi:class I SAM-dependent methyltransferase [Pseudalkalibacillus sp. Hm43]|uniref:class I SAM-dependent methyltransferase n=1 Tax=Pseudalkalibacillus sp. Hm43 TaxID=3450742 RepID=UPI003F4400CB
MKHTLHHQYRTSKPLNARIQLHEMYGTNPVSWSEWYFNQMRFSDTDTILDVGCGTGWFWAENAKKLPKSLKLFLMDQSAGMIEEAKNNLEAAGVSAEFYVGDLCSLPFHAEEFDIVMANHMLYHLSDHNRKKGLMELRRVLKQGGTCYTSTVGENHLVELSQILKDFNPSLRYDTSKFHQAFGLQNGQSQLQEIFSEVSRSLYDCHLKVTEARPLVEYVLSTMSEAAIELQTDNGKSFEDFIALKIQQVGPVFITKETGYFKSSK